MQKTNKILNMSNISNILKDLRTQKQIFQKQIANDLKISYVSQSTDYLTNTYGSWERGNTEPPIDMLIALAKYFNVPVDYLIGNANEDSIIIIQNELSEDENYLIDLVRQLNMKDKSTIYELTELMVQAKKKGERHAKLL